MQMTFDPLVPAELAAVQRMLDGLSGNKTIEIKLTQGEIDSAADEAVRRVGELARRGGTVGAAVARTATEPLAPPTTQQCDAMDDTGDIRKFTTDGQVDAGQDHMVGNVQPTETGAYVTGRSHYDPAAATGGDPAASAIPLVHGTILADPDRIRHVQGDPLPLAPSTAAAPASPSAPEAPQAGAAVDPSVFGQSAASAPVPAVPSAPVATASPVPVDSAGLPWDERIHSSSRAKVADGSWRQRRNLPDGLREQVEAELRVASPPAPRAPEAHPIVITGQSDVAAESSDLTPAAPAVSAPPLPPAVPAPPPVPLLPAIPSSTPPAAAPAPGAATASGEPMVPAGDFVALFGKVTKLIAEQPGVFGESDVEDMCERLGLPRKGGMMQLPGICMADAARGAQLVADFDAAVEGVFA